MIRRGSYPRRGQRGFALGCPLLLFLAVASPDLVRSQTPPGDQVIESVQVVGNQSIPTERIVNLTRLGLGDRLTSMAARHAVERLWATGLFTDVRLLTGEVEGGSLALTIRVVEAPVVREVVVEGAEKLSAKDIRQKIGVIPGDRVRPGLLAQGRRRVLDQYEEKGYFLARVSTQLEEFEGGGKRLRVVIGEGRKVAIRHIEFLGSEAFSDDRLRGEMKTKTEGFFPWQNGEFKRESFRGDLASRLPAFYRNEGFLDFAIVEDSLYVDPTSGKADLFITVEEGPRYTVGEVEVTGNERFPASLLKALVQLQPGEAFSQKRLDESTQSLQELYLNDGYIYAQIQPGVSRRPEEQQVDLLWAVAEGEPAHIRMIDIRGNRQTHESVIRRRMYFMPGDKFNQDALIASMRSIQNTGFFRSIVPETRTVPGSGDIDLILRVEEQRTGSLQVGAALGAGTGLAGFIGYEQPNLFGRGKRGTFRWQFGRRDNTFQLGYTEPNLLNTRASLSLDFQKGNQRTTFNPFRIKQTGGSVRLGLPLPGIDYTRVFLGYGLRDLTFEPLGSVTRPSEREFLEDFSRVESRASLSFVRDTRDNFFQPSLGSRQTLGFEVSGGLLQGTTEYQKITFESDWYAPSFWKFVLHLKAKGGNVSGGEIPPSEEFILGGVQTEGLRGYPEGSVGPAENGSRRDLRNRANTFLLMTSEYLLRVSDMVEFSLFFDTGDSWDGLQQVDLGGLKRGAGVGLRVVVPGFGPLGLDYAYGFDRIDPVTGRLDPGWQLHFKFGQFF